MQQTWRRASLMGLLPLFFFSFFHTASGAKVVVIGGAVHQSDTKVLHILSNIFCVFFTASHPEV